VVDVDGQLRIGIGILEWLGQQDLVDGLRGRLDSAHAGEVFTERLANEISQRHASRLGEVRGAPVKVGRQKKLRPVHV
jgi:hypothetical protein